MKHITKLKLATIHQLCDVEDKSTEWMLQTMQDIYKVDLDCVLAYMSLSEKETSALFVELNELTEVMIIIESLLPQTDEEDEQ